MALKTNAAIVNAAKTRIANANIDYGKTEHRTPNTEHGTPNAEHRTPNTEHSITNHVIKKQQRWIISGVWRTTAHPSAAQNLRGHGGSVPECCLQKNHTIK
ncbi:MAG: hypothetical protein WCK07_22500 [Betaproteobacteria bacterium]